MNQPDTSAGSPPASEAPASDANAGEGSTGKVDAGPPVDFCPVIDAEWKAADLLALGREYHERSQRLHSELQRFRAVTKDFEKHELAETARGEAAKQLEEVFEKRATDLCASGDATIQYDRTLSSLDLDRIVYSGDRHGLIGLLSKAPIALGLHSALADDKPFNARKDLLTRGLKLTRGMAPFVHEVLDRCIDALMLTTPVEVYVYHEPIFNAACYPPRKDKVLLAITSALLEGFSADEIAFVIGHEIGHYLFEHTRHPLRMLLGSVSLSPIEAMSVFAWSRAAELTADRVGMLCCQSFPAAASAFFKLSAGVTGERLKFDLDDYLKQLRELQGELTGDDDPEIWFSTHPFNPLRIKALDAFVRGKTYRTLIGQPTKGATSDARVEQELVTLLKIMQPAYLTAEDGLKDRVKRFMLVAGYMIASVNGTVDDRELEALAEILSQERSLEEQHGPPRKKKGKGGDGDGDEGGEGQAEEKPAPPTIDPAVLEEVKAMSLEAAQEEALRIARELNHMMVYNVKTQMMHDLSIISIADGALDDVELEALYKLADALGINSHFVDHVITSAVHSDGND